jgi:hypothetical protein
MDEVLMERFGFNLYIAAGVVFCIGSFLAAVLAWFPGTGQLGGALLLLGCLGAVILEGISVIIARFTK